MNATNIFTPLDWQVPAWRDRNLVVLLAGSAGGGKSRLAAEKIHGYLLHYPGAAGLVVRKTLNSMLNSTLLFLERAVMGAGRGRFVHHHRSARRFEYANGSVLVYGGMHDEAQREHIRSIGPDGALDVVWMEEATRFVESDFDEVLARMRGKAAPWRQVILSTNPGPPNHWIYKRLIVGGGAKVYESGAKDNRHNPSEYLQTLGLLTGTLRARMAGGRWVASEGVVYADFDHENLTDDEPIPGLPVELAYDDGYVDPRAILVIQRSGTRLLVAEEIYHSKHLEETCVSEIVELCQRRGWGLPVLAVGSPEAVALREHFRKAGIAVRSPGGVGIVEGIKAVRRLVCDGQGVRSLQVNRRCTNLISELTDGYRYPDSNGAPRRDEEKPLDGNDHAADALRYWVSVRMRR